MIKIKTVNTKKELIEFILENSYKDDEDYSKIFPSRYYLEDELFFEDYDKPIEEAIKNFRNTPQVYPQLVMLHNNMCDCLSCEYRQRIIYITDKENKGK